MPPPREFHTGQYYHIYNRGANRQRIFRSPENYRFLLRRVRKYTLRDCIAVIAYCLMPNHYHFFLRQDGEVSISTCVQAIFNSYAKAFNQMWGRSGTLFEGRFKHVHVDTDAYLIHLCRYIHRNPIDGDRPLVAQIEEWPYSNYTEWMTPGDGALTERAFMEEHFTSPEEYRRFVLDYDPPEKLMEKLGAYLLD